MMEAHICDEKKSDDSQGWRRILCRRDKLDEDHHGQGSCQELKDEKTQLFGCHMGVMNCILGGRSGNSGGKVR